MLANNLFKTDTDIMLLHMQGDFDLNILTFLDLLLYQKKDHKFYLSGAYLQFKDGTVEAYTRGRDSKKEDRYYFDTKEFEAKGVELSYIRFDKQLELYAGFTKTFINPNAIRDKDGNQVANNIGNTRSTIYRYGIYLDDTNSRLDPKVGYRVQLETLGIKHDEKKLSDGFQRDISITGFFPIVKDTHIFVANYFFSEATITKVGEVDPTQYQCDPLDTSCDQSIYDKVREDREHEVKKGNATSLGGTQRLRAYPQGRFYDTYSAFFGFEHRWYIKNYWKPFDKYLWKGVNTGIQIAFFQEFGQVNDKNNHKLYEDMKSSTGVGIRVLFNTMTARLDIATSDEGEQVVFFYGYSF
ncbi:MAG: hypothetical protein B1H07_02660 [Campylobacteraceae bacterium 4484_166]|nr:MAG: hypothetical protein B1H07_02660 [Campylobacteraceae bacterium 4484_166]